MTLTVAPTVARGTAQLLQPFYYTSSLFVEPMREDIASLLSAFTTAYSEELLEPVKPFQIFKNVWHGEGWDLIHLRVLDLRAREVFLRTVVRLFVERMSPAEYPLTRVGALFGLYTFYGIQKASLAGRIPPQEYITLTIDTYEQLLMLPNALQSSLRAYATYIISQLVQTFHIIPHSSLEAQNPRTLPHSIPILTRDIDYGHKKKVGRPSRLAQSRKADEALSALERFVDRLEVLDGETASTASSSSLLPERPVPSEYVGLKDRLRGTVSGDAIRAAETLTMERVRNADRYVTDRNLPIGAREGLEMLEDAAIHENGLLGLVSATQMNDLGDTR